MQGEKVPFLMPVMFRGRRPKRKPKKGVKKDLRWIKRQKAGWYRHTLKNGTTQATISVCVAYRTYHNRKKRKRGQQKLLFAAWRVGRTPTVIRERYRTLEGEIKHPTCQALQVRRQLRPRTRRPRPQYTTAHANRAGAATTPRTRRATTVARRAARAVPRPARRGGSRRVGAAAWSHGA